MDNVIQNHAWCVGHPNFVPLAQIAQEHGFQEQSNVLLVAVENGVSANAVMTGPRSNGSLGREHTYSVLHLRHPYK
jgi:hypothetical protein